MKLSDARPRKSFYIAWDFQVEHGITTYFAFSPPFLRSQRLAMFDSVWGVPSCNLSWPIQRRFAYQRWGFSIAILDYQRVLVAGLCEYSVVKTLLGSGSMTSPWTCPGTTMPACKSTSISWNGSSNRSTRATCFAIGYLQDFASAATHANQVSNTELHSILMHIIAFYRDNQIVEDRIVMFQTVEH